MAQYMMPAARSQNTGRLVKKQDLAGRRYLPSDSAEVWLVSQSLAEDLSRRTRESWVAEPITYTGS